MMVEEENAFGVSAETFREIARLIEWIEFEEQE